MAQHFLLLLGAGFSRNWGGWLARDVFEFLISRPEITGDPVLKEILWNNVDSGFEAALEQVQRDAAEDPQSEVKLVRLNVFQTAITSMFAEMNTAFFEQTKFEPHNSVSGTIRQFLSRFDAIFTLNQDLLLEHFYKDQYDIALESPRRWDAIQLPGMQRLPVDDPIFHDSWARAQWRPMPDADYEFHPRCQPYIKLHGSCNWVSSKGKPLLIMGGGKEEAIQQHKILSRYAIELKARLRRPGTRLMVIGYGFRDHYINRMIADSVYHHGLRMFVVSPDWRDVLKSARSSLHAAIPLMVHGYDLEHVLQQALIGASSREMLVTFGGDSAELRKLLRFFEP